MSKNNKYIFVVLDIAVLPQYGLHIKQLIKNIPKEQKHVDWEEKASINCLTCLPANSLQMSEMLHIRGVNLNMADVSTTLQIKWEFIYL